MKKTFIYIATLMTTAFLASCSASSDAYEEELPGDFPLTFSQVAIQSLRTTATHSKTANTTSSTNQTSDPLQQGFIVNAWKDFQLDNQKTVMDNYQVKYHYDSWNSVYSWEYASKSETYIKEQKQTYWDKKGFPYAFYALTPYPEDASGITFTTNHLTIPETGVFQFQTCDNGRPSTGREDFFPCQIIRNADGKDYDLMIDNGTKEINTGSTALTRQVSLPFHHFTSKVRFGIYSGIKEGSLKDVPVTDIKIKVTSNNFITEARGYDVDLSTTPLLKGKFTKLLSTQEHPVLLTTDDKESNLNDLALCNSDDKAFMMYCTDGILQIPQSGVQLSISFKIGTNIFKDIPLVLNENGTSNDSFTWNPNYIYTYLIKVKDIVKREIECTAQIIDWDYIYATINTDLEK
jgi:hypothetical protein